MCEVRIVKYNHPFKKDSGVRIDLAGYQSQIKTVEEHQNIPDAEKAADDWSKLTGWNVVCYVEEEIVEMRLSKPSVAEKADE